MEANKKLSPDSSMGNEMQPIEERALTFGERLCGIKFNPSNDLREIV